MSESRHQSYQAPAEVDGLMKTAGLIGVVGIIASVVGAIGNPDQFFRSYLVAFMFVLAPALGGLALMMVHHLSGGAWGIPVRRLFEAGSRTIPLLALAFIPIVFGMHHIFEWTHLDVVAKDPILQAKQPYLNTSFFIIRAVIYFAVWSGLALMLTSMSKGQDTNPMTEEGTSRFGSIAAPGLVLYVLTLSFASFDWVMSLDPHWFSTVFGLLMVVGQGLSALTFTVAIGFRLSRTPAMESALTPNKFHDYGKLMFAFTMLWAYLAFSQFLIIWSANLPEEIPWYIRRFTNGWGPVSILLAVGPLHLPVPDAALQHAEARGVAAVAARVVHAGHALHRPALADHAELPRRPLLVPLARRDDRGGAVRPLGGGVLLEPEGPRAAAGR